MKRAAIAFVVLWAVFLSFSSVGLADECVETPDCQEGYVCEHGQCIEVPAECAEFCENMAPCFSNGMVCEGGEGAPFPWREMC